MDIKCIDHDLLMQEDPLYRFYYNFLLDRFNGPDLTTREAVQVMRIGYATFNKRKQKGENFPCYTQDEEIKNARIYFPLPCMAFYLSKNKILII